MALKMQKEREMKVHERFYNNVHLLTLNYPPVESFTLVFKKDMFIKTNKVGFQQVTYYLLEILDKELLKQKVPTWPLYDVRSENEFRNEVMKYVNELNTIHEDANIPNIATSHLITPGGFKFIKFMFKLSQFVLFKHLQRTQNCGNMLLPLRPSKKEAVTKENIERMEIATQNINTSTNDLKTNFEDNSFEAARINSVNIMRKLCEVTDLNEEYKVKLTSLKEQLQKGSLEVPLHIHKEIDSNFKKFQLLKEKAEQAKLLSSYLEKPLVLAYNEEFLSIPDPMKQIQIENGTLSLINLLESCIRFTDRKRLEIKPMSQQNLQKEVERFTALNKKLSSLLEDMNDISAKSTNLSEKLKNETVQDKYQSILNGHLDSNNLDLDVPLTVTL